MAVTINSQWDADVYKAERERARQHINSAWDAKVFYETYGGNGKLGDWGTPQWAEKRAYGNTTYFTYNPATGEWTQYSASSFSTGGFKSVASNMVYDPVTRTWTKRTGALSFNPNANGAVSQTGVVNRQKDASSDSKTGAEKQYIDIEFNTLVGDMTLIPTKENMKIHTNNTIELRGVGKYLSGLFFVSEVKRTLDANSGYTLSIGIYRNGFGDSLKKAQDFNSSRPTQVDNSQNIVQSHFKVGDKVRIVGENAVYSNAHEGVKVPNWVKTQILTIDALSEDGQRARLNPIWSWTYIKFLQLA